MAMTLRLARLLPAAAVLAAAGASAEPVTYRIDPTHTFVTFEAVHRDTSTLRGRFERSEGTVVLDRQARTGRVEVRVDTGSLSTGVKPLDAKLMGKDYLDAGDMPPAGFIADRFVFEGDQLVSVTGTLTLLGVTQPLTLAATHFGCYTNPLLKREVCGGDFETTLVRSLWGMTRGLDTGVPDRIRLLVQVEAIRQ
jgi:polyisoprenoid-binding protein YceI